MARDENEPTGAPAAAVTPGAQAGPAPRRRAPAGQPGGPGARSTPGTQSTPGPGSGGRMDPAVWLIASATFAAYTAISVSRYLRLDPGTWDLGIYTEYVRQFSLLRAPVVDIKAHNFNLLGDHFTPIVALIAPFFRLFPTPLTLLVAQALLVAVSVVPVCRAARDRLGLVPSRAIGIAYGFSWGLQQMVDFAFHELAFAVPLLAFSLSALVRRRVRTALLWALPLVFVKEDQGITVAAIGVAMLAAAAWARAGRLRRRLPGWGAAVHPDAALVGLARAGTWAWAGSVLIVWGLGWSVLAITVIIPHFNPAHHYAYWKDGGVIHPGGSFQVPGLLHQLARGSPEKLRTTAMIALPTAFIALASPLSLVAVPSLALRFISVHHAFWGTSFHYNAPVMPIMFLAAVDALARISAYRARGYPSGSGVWPACAAAARYGPAAMVVIAAGLAFAFPISHLWLPRTYMISPHVRAEEAAMARVPDGVTVEASESMLASLAARDETSWTVNRGIHDPEYIVLDTTQDNAAGARGHPLKLVERFHAGAAYQQIFQDDHVYVFRRGRPALHQGRQRVPGPAPGR